jgi:hypothetical protein
MYSFVVPGVIWLDAVRILAFNNSAVGGDKISSNKSYVANKVCNINFIKMNNTDLTRET